MCSYYSNEDIEDMIPLNYDQLASEEQTEIIQEIALMTGLSVDRVLEALNEQE